MTRHALRIPDYLEHILGAIERINRYTSDMSEVVFLDDEKTQDAVIRNFEVIGEAARNIERNHAEFAAKYPDIPWDDAYSIAQSSLAWLLQSRSGNCLANHSARFARNGARYPAIIEFALR